MLRPIDQDLLFALQRSAVLDDPALDLALMRIGVLAPAELGEIRSVLQRPGGRLNATSNAEGHCIVRVAVDGAIVASLHHDGRVFHEPMPTAA